MSERKGAKLKRPRRRLIVSIIKRLVVNVNYRRSSSSAGKGYAAIFSFFVLPLNFFFAPTTQMCVVVNEGAHSGKLVNS